MNTILTFAETEKASEYLFEVLRGLTIEAQGTIVLEQKSLESGFALVSDSVVVVVVKVRLWSERHRLFISALRTNGYNGPVVFDIEEASVLAQIPDRSNFRGVALLSSPEEGVLKSVVRRALFVKNAHTCWRERKKVHINAYLFFKGKTVSVSAVIVDISEVGARIKWNDSFSMSAGEKLTLCIYKGELHDAQMFECQIVWINQHSRQAGLKFHHVDEEFSDDVPALRDEKPLLGDQRS